MTEDLSLHAFTSIDGVGDLDTFVEALIAFDAIAELQELKEIERAMVAPGSHVLDVGCGFGLETVRLSQRVGPSPPVAGIDASAHFIDEARRRAAAARLVIDYRVGKAEALPYPDATFDHVRAERLLIYLHDVRGAVAEMQRVLSPGGTLALIEPDFGTTTVNLPDRALVRRAMAHEADTAVAQSWLPGTLRSMLGDLRFPLGGNGDPRRRLSAGARQGVFRQRCHERAERRSDLRRRAGCLAGRHRRLGPCRPAVRDDRLFPVHGDPLIGRLPSRRAGKPSSRASESAAAGPLVPDRGRNGPTQERKGTRRGGGRCRKACGRVRPFAVWRLEAMSP